MRVVVVGGMGIGPVVGLAVVTDGERDPGSFEDVGHLASTSTAGTVGGPPADESPPRGRSRTAGVARRAQSSRS